MTTETPPWFDDIHDDLVAVLRKVWNRDISATDGVTDLRACLAHVYACGQAAPLQPSDAVPDVSTIYRVQMTRTASDLGWRTETVILVPVNPVGEIHGDLHLQASTRLSDPPLLGGYHNEDRAAVTLHRRPHGAETGGSHAG